MKCKYCGWELTDDHVCTTTGNVMSKSVIKRLAVQRHDKIREAFESNNLKLNLTVNGVELPKDKKDTILFFGFKAGYKSRDKEISELKVKDRKPLEAMCYENVRAQIFSGNWVEESEVRELEADYKELEIINRSLALKTTELEQQIEDMKNDIQNKDS